MQWIHYEVQHSIDGGSTWYRTTLPRYKTLNEAVRTAEKLRTQDRQSRVLQVTSQIVRTFHTVPRISPPQSFS